MKAILVIDMPETCSDCKLCYECCDCIVRPEDTPYDKTKWFEAFTDARMPWCPPRPLPEKKEYPFSIEAIRRASDELELVQEAAQGYIMGWNACLDAITGGKES